MSQPYPPPPNPHYPYNQGWPASGGYPYPPQPPAPKKHRKWPWIVGGTVLLLIIIGSVSKPSTPSTPTVVNAAPAASPAATPAQAGPVSSFGDGTYHVGTDIPAGRYKTPGPSQDSIIKDCYWERTRDDSGQFGSIISNGNATGPGYITVKSGEFFQTSGGCTWSKQ